MKLKMSVCFLLFTASLFSQQEDFIRGRLLDSKTQEPIPFATIRIKGYALGVISNNDGGFRIPQKFKKYGDVLEISSMGYRSKEWRISELSPENINIIRLEPGLLQLQEAIVVGKIKKRLSARQIVRRAIKNIPNNYPLNDFSTVGYYRDYQLDKNEYINLNEAILEVFDKGFYKLDSTTTNVRIYDYKQNIDFKRDTLADDMYDYNSWRKIIDKAYLFNYGGNEFTILRVHDAIRNYKVNSFDFINKLETDLLGHHSFRRRGDTFLNDEAVLYTIDFKKTHPDFNAFGTLYISQKDFAIYKMEYAVYDDDRKGNSTKKQNKHGTDKRMIFEIITEYQRNRDNNKMFINYISFYNSFQLKYPPKFVVKDILVDAPASMFVVHFNNKVDSATAAIKGNYNFKFKGEKLRFKKLEISGDSVMLHPDMKIRELENMMREFDAINSKRVPAQKLLSVEIENILDVQGNMLNRWTSRDINQFREYFVQQVQPNKMGKLDTLYMKKNRPIFKDQPIIRPDNFKDYWMNTPLQGNIN